MTYWNSIFQEWQEIQQQFVEKLNFELPQEYSQNSFPPWDLPHLQTFMSWGQSAVKQSMELQSHWLDQWANQMDTTIQTSNDSKADMVKRIQESMSGWSDNQSELWAYWFKMIEESSDSIENTDILNEHLATWRSTVDESISSQTEYLNKWSEKINVEELTSEELKEITSQIQETMQGCLNLQNELWQQWFEFLRLNKTNG